MPLASIVSPSPLEQRLLNAAWEGDAPEVANLLDQGVPVDVRGADGWTPLHRAVWFDHTQTIGLLLDRGATVNATDAEQGTPLHRAALRGTVDTIRLLIGRGADIEARAHQGWSPLHQAACWNHIDAILELIEHGADIESEDHEGKTPLRAAIENGAPSSALGLVAAGGRLDPAWPCLPTTLEKLLEMNRVRRLDRLSAAAEIGHLALLKRAVDALDPSQRFDEVSSQLRVAVQHANEHHWPEGAAFLQSCLASRAIDASKRCAMAVRPL